MEGVYLIEPTRLYNLLNQGRDCSFLGDPNFLLLLDIRNPQEYTESHILTAKLCQKSRESILQKAEEAGLETVKHIILYDGKTSTIDDGTVNHLVVRGAKHLWEAGSKNPVGILQGGYEIFSSLFPFLRTSKQMYTSRELESLPVYPNEVVPGLLYVASWSQCRHKEILTHLNIKLYVIIRSTRDQDAAADWLESTSPGDLFHIDAQDESSQDIESHFATVCALIEQHRQSQAGAVLIVSEHGISRACSFAMAYVMRGEKRSLQESWSHLLNCKSDMRPNRGFVKQLSTWEKELGHGSAITDISEPNY